MVFEIDINKFPIDGVEVATWTSSGFVSAFTLVPVAPVLYHILLRPNIRVVINVLPSNEFWDAPIRDFAKISIRIGDLILSSP